MVFLISCAYNYGQSSLPKDHYVILPFDKDVHTSLPEKSINATLDEEDFVSIDQLLSVCINKYNREQTAEYKKMTKKFPNLDFVFKDFVIDLKRYYRQYLAV